MPCVNGEWIAFDRPHLDHRVPPAVQLQHRAWAAVRPHQAVADIDGLDGADRSIEHQDRRSGGVATGRGHAQGVRVLPERANAALDEQPLSRSEQHGCAVRSLCPGRADAGLRLRWCRGRRRDGWRRSDGSAHVPGVVPVVRGDRLADLVLRIAVDVLTDVDTGEELDAVEVLEAVDAACRLRLRRGVLVRDAAAPS